MGASPLPMRVAELLERHGLEAIPIGNSAAALHGAPVTTIDLDFLFRKTPANLKKLKAIAVLSSTPGPVIALYVAESMTVISPDTSLVT
jgi:hypothetical protein